MQPVLIVGAGPTGLVLALWLARLGGGVRLIDKADGPGKHLPGIRGECPYPRILRADRHRRAGYRRWRQNAGPQHPYRLQGVCACRFSNFGVGLSAYPFILMLPQEEHERILGEQLSRQGVEVEWQTELVDFSDEDDRVRTRLKRHDGAPQTCEAAFLCGCDGAHSLVREQLGAGFPGGTYDEIFYVADVE